MIIIVFLPCKPLMDDITAASVSLSSAEVASSNTRTAGFEYNALAIPILSVHRIDAFPFHQSEYEFHLLAL